MISCILCSRTKDVSKAFKQNIAETIGAEYELIVIDNSKNKYSIFSAYNEGVRHAKGDILCFMHEDILYKTLEWGKQVETIMQDISIGCLGVIGSYMLPKNSGYWYDVKPYMTGRVLADENHSVDCNENGYVESEVVAVDGMWFCIQKSMFQTISFDEQTYQGFHWYDMDICMQILNIGKKISIIRTIEIIHENHNPQINLSFIENMELFYTKWNRYLPIYRSVTPSEIEFLKISERTEVYYQQLKKFLEYKERIENSLSYKLGNAIAEPYRKIMRYIKGKNT